MKYKAFISYNQKDSGFTIKLHQALIQQATELAPPDNIQIFRDRVCMGVNEPIDKSLYTYLEASEWLIVICSPHVHSPDGEKNYVDIECDYFANQLGRGDHIICVIAETAPELREISTFYPPSLIHVKEEGNLLAADARQNEWNACVGNVIARMYGKNFEEYYNYRQKLEFEKEYKSIIEKSSRFLSRKDYGQAETLLEKYRIPQKYADFKELEWNYVCSLASRYAFPNYLGTVPVSSLVRKECISFDTVRKLLYWGDAQGNIFMLTLCTDKPPVKFTCSSLPIEGIFLLQNGNLVLLTKKTVEVRTLTNCTLDLIVTYPIEYTFYPSQSSVFVNFYTNRDTLFATDGEKHVLAVLTNASVTTINLQTGGQTVLPIPNPVFWEMGTRIRWNYIRVEKEYVILGMEERIICWSLVGNLLFDYKRKYYLKPISPIEEKNSYLSTNGKWRFRFAEGGLIELLEPESEEVKVKPLKYPKQKIAIEEFVSVCNAIPFLVFHYENGEKNFYSLENDEKDICFSSRTDDPDRMDLTETIFLKKEKEVYSLWKEKKEIPVEYGLGIRFFESEEMLVSHQGKCLLVYDLEGNYLREIPVREESAWFFVLNYDLDVRRHLCAYLTKGGEEIELINIELPGTVTSRLTLFQAEEKNLIKKAITKMKKESFIASVIKFLPEGNLLIGCKNGAILFWDRIGPAHKVAEHFKDVERIQISPGQKYAVSLSGQEIFWYELSNAVPASKEPFYCPFKIISLLFMNERELLGCSENGELLILDLEEKTSSHLLSTGIDRVYELCVSPDKTMVVLLSEDVLEEEKCRLSFWSLKEKVIVLCQHFNERIMNIFFNSQNELVFVYLQRLEIVRINNETDLTWEMLKEQIIKRRYYEKELVTLTSSYSL